MRIKLVLQTLVAAWLSAGLCNSAEVGALVNQRGKLPSTRSGVVEMKFTIVTHGENTPAMATARLDGGKLMEIVVVDGGSGFRQAPAVTILGGRGRGALARARLEEGSISAIEVTAGGTGYSGLPEVRVALPPANTEVTTHWSNDGSSTDGREPVSAVHLQVSQGRYSALLGYTGLPNMAPLPSEILGLLNARVRVWYKTKEGFKRIPGSEPLQAVPFALQALYAAESGTVSDGAITAAKLAPGAVGGAAIAPGAVGATQLAADLTTDFGRTLWQTESAGALRTLINPPAWQAGVKVVERGIDLWGAAPDYPGQIMISLDGSFGISRSAEAGHVNDGISILADPIFFKTLDRGGSSGVINSGRISVSVPPGPFVDNAIEVRNFSGGYSAINFGRAGDPPSVGLAIGIARHGFQDYSGGYIATNAERPTDPPMHMTISMHGGPAAQQHRRLFFDSPYLGADHDYTITAYGWTEATTPSDDVRTGPVGWHVASSGAMGIGTTAIAPGAQATVGGTGIVHLSGVTMRTGPTWTSGNGSPEGMVAAPIGSLYSRIDGSAGSAFYVKESGEGTSGWVAK